MRDVVLPRFLAADDLPRCTFAVTLTAAEGGVRASFESRIALPNGIERTRTHAEATFGGDVSSATPPTEATAELEVPAERVYRELVRFGPHFRNLRGTLRLARSGGWGTVESPAPPHANPSARRVSLPARQRDATWRACGASAMQGSWPTRQDSHRARWWRRLRRAGVAAASAPRTIEPRQADLRPVALRRRGPRVRCHRGLGHGAARHRGHRLLLGLSHEGRREHRAPHPATTAHAHRRGRGSHRRELYREHVHGARFVADRRGRARRAP